MFLHLEQQPTMFGIFSVPMQPTPSPILECFCKVNKRNSEEKNVLAHAFETRYFY